MKTILFLCVENSCRSQIAETFAKKYEVDGIKAMSAGSKPSGEINPRAIQLMSEIGSDMANQFSKSVDDLKLTRVDYLILMGCGDSCPYLKAETRIEWDIPDPKNLTKGEFREVIEKIEEKVENLIQKLI